MGADALPASHARRWVIEARIDRALGKSAAIRLREALALLGEAGEPLQTMLAELDMSREIEALPAAELCAKVRLRAERLEQFGAAIKARFYRVDALVRARELDAACVQAREALALLESRRPVDMYSPECWWSAFPAFDAAGGEEEALAALRCAVEWIQRQALPNVPAEFRDSFLHRNSINRSVLTTATRQLRQ